MSLGRPLSFDREQVLGRVAEVFRMRGFEGASLQDLLAATGLSKSSLYQQYGNKQALFSECLARYADTMQADLQAGLSAAPNGRAFIAAVLDQIISEPQPPKGCLIFNTASEFGQVDEKVAAQVRQIFARVREVLIQAIELDRSAGRMTADQNAQDLANFLMASIAGLRTLLKGGMPQGELRRTCKVILAALD